MMWKEAGVLLSSLVNMIKKHQFDSCLKVQSLDLTSILFKVPGCTDQSLGSICCHDLEKGLKSLVGVTIP